MKSVMGICFSWKVLVGLGAIGVALVVIAPSIGVAMLPLLLLAACPVSMLLMMRAMGGAHGHDHHTGVRSMRTEPDKSLQERIEWLERELRARDESAAVEP